MTTDIPQPAVRSADRGAATRAALLGAAREVFTSVGYAQAGVSEIVARANASVGSLYHHFTGKADLYVTLFEEFHQTPTAAGPAGGPRSPDRPGGARGQRRRPSSCSSPRPGPTWMAASSSASCPGCCVCGDAPPGFDLIMRQRLRDWADRNTDFFARGTDPLDEALAVVMTGALMLAVAEVSLGEDAGHARRLADGVLDVMSSIGVPPRR